MSLVFHPRMNLSCSFAPLIARSLRGWGLMPMRFATGLECKIVVAGCTSTVFDLCRVVGVVTDWCCMLEDMFDYYSS